MPDMRFDLGQETREVGGRIVEPVILRDGPGENRLEVLPQQIALAVATAPVRDDNAPDILKRDRCYALGPDEKLTFSAPMSPGSLTTTGWVVPI